MKTSQRSSYRWLIAVIFILYIFVLAYLVFFSDSYGRNNAEILRYQDINLTPFKTIWNYLHAWKVVHPMVIITNVYGNIAAFLPFGFLGPVVFRPLKRFSVLFIYSLMFSLGIEGIQGLFGVGVVDIDDILLNVLGGLMGYGLYRLFFKIKKKQTKQK